MIRFRPLQKDTCHRGKAGLVSFLSKSATVVGFAEGNAGVHNEYNDRWVGLAWPPRPSGSDRLRMEMHIDKLQKNVPIRGHRAMICMHVVADAVQNRRSGRRPLVGIESFFSQ
jgi:hypothetical protein